MSRSILEVLVAQKKELGSCYQSISKQLNKFYNSFLFQSESSILIDKLKVTDITRNLVHVIFILIAWFDWLILNINAYFPVEPLNKT